MYVTLSIICQLVGVALMILGALYLLFGGPFTDKMAVISLVALGGFTAFCVPNLMPKAPANAAKRDVVTKSVKLASLANGTATTTRTTSSFLATVSTTSQDPIYQFVRENNDGSYQIDTISGTTRVREDATAKTARIDTTRCEYVSADVRDKWGETCGDEVTTIHVPKGSILRNYRIDANKQ